MQVKIEIPVSLIQSTLDQLSDFQGFGHIGWVGIAGDWNNWGDSPEKAGCVRPKDADLMKLEGDKYVWEGDLSIGIHRFKPVVVTTEADPAGMCGASWIRCPSKGIGPYTREPGDRHSNWQVKVLPKR